MQIIKEDIRTSQFKPAYLLYGTEDYLKKLYQDKLKEAILLGSDDMNFSFFEGRGIDEDEVIAIAQTLPFFSERRLVLLKNSGFFKNQNRLADHIKDVPETTLFLFVESEVDKRSRLYKAVKEIGHISEMNGLDERNLKLWIASLLHQEQKKITEQTLDYFLGKSGTDMKSLVNEVEKLICFAYDRDVITPEDIDTVCTTQITGKIFQMIDAIGFHRQVEALNLYYDLLALREKPMSILYLIIRHFNILLQVMDLAGQGLSGSQLAGKAGIPRFALNKYMAQSKRFSYGQIMDILSDCADTEEKVKTGRLLEGMGVELLIVTYSRA